MTSYLADSVWWDGRLRAPIPLPDISEMSPRRLPGTVLPGLIDAHVHSGLVDLATVRAGGIAGVWDLGSVPAAVAELASAAPARKLPTIRFAGPFLIAPGGYPSDRSWAAPGSWRAVTSPADGGEAVAAAHALGAGLIKITAHAGGPRLDHATMTAIADDAHRLGLEVVVHAEGPGTVRAAYEAGADLLAHTPWTEPLDPGLARFCAERMRWISTLDIHGWGTETPDRVTAVGNLRLFREYGGRVRYGTDLGNGPLIPGVNPREIRALQAAGLSPDDILTAMTGPDLTWPPAKTGPPAMTGPAAMSGPAAVTGPAAVSGPAAVTGPGLTWVPGGLDLDPTRFADSLATARVLDDSVRPR